MKFKNISVDVNVITIFIVYTSLMIIRFIINVWMPDELYFTQGKVFEESGDIIISGVFSEGVALKYTATSWFFSSVYDINKYLLPSINIILTIFLLKYSYNLVCEKNKQYILLFFFLLPAVNFFAVTYLRDIYVAYLLLTIFVLIRKGSRGIKILLIFIQHQTLFQLGNRVLKFLQSIQRSPPICISVAMLRVDFKHRLIMCNGLFNFTIHGQSQTPI